MFLPEALRHIHGKGKLPDQPVALTFDDGYLDNWTVVAPLLDKYGFCGTIFVNPEFVDPRDVVRRQVNNSQWAHISRELVDGYMSWEELRRAQQSGIFDIQSHGMTHTWYFSSDKIIDFHHPGDRYPWLAWNARPGRKYLWLAEDQSTFVDFGVPVYAHGKSLIVRRYYEPEEMNVHLARFVKENGGDEFFMKPDWRSSLFTEVSKVDFEGRYETEEERRTRVHWELGASKEEISSKMDKPVEIMCWPGGGKTDLTFEVARQVGYKGWIISGLPNKPIRRTPGIGRTSIPNFDVGPLTSFVNKLIFVYKVKVNGNAGCWPQVGWIVRKLRIGKQLMKRSPG